MNTIFTFNAKRLLLIVIIAVPFALFMNLHNSNVVTVRAEYPKEVIAGTSFTVTVTIDKGNLSGFGRYTHTLPDGLRAESNSQNFEFSDNTVKFLWINIPYASTFTFSYVVHVPVDYKQSITINGKFGYVVDNERRFSEIIPNQIKVINDPLALRKYQAEQAAKLAPVNIDDVTAYRTLNITGNEAIVSIRVNKANVNSMCKIEEMLPEGYVFYAIDRENSDFSSHNNIARFMWIDAPQKDIFYVSYKVIPNPGYSIKNLFINGAFSFVDNGITQSVVILDRDLSAISESTGKPLETSLDPNYNANLQSGLSKTDQVNATPSTSNYSSRAPYDISSQNINSDLSTNKATLQTKSPSTTRQINTTAKPVEINPSLPESNEELATNLKSKNYSQNQIDFFTSSNISTKPQPYTGTYSPAEDVQTNLQSKANPLPNPNNKPTVNINAIPAPSTYFPTTQQYSVDDPDNASAVVNPSYNRTMESGGVNAAVQQGANHQQTTTQSPTQTQTAQTNTKPGQQPSTAQAQNFENTIHIPAPNLQQQNQQAVKQQTIEEVAKTTPHITTLPDGTKPSDAVQYSQSNQTRVSSPGSVSTSSQYSVQQANNAQPSTTNATPQVGTSRIATQTVDGSTPTTQQVSVQNGVTTQAGTTKIPTQTVNSSTPRVQQVQVQNGVASTQPSAYGLTTQPIQQSTTQPSTVRIATQTVQGTNPTTQQVQVQNGVATTQGTTATTSSSARPGQVSTTTGTKIAATQGVQPTTNGVTALPYQQTTTTQPNTVRIATQTVQGTTPTTQQVQVQNGVATTQGTTATISTSARPGQVSTATGTTTIASQGLQPTSNGVTAQSYQQTTTTQPNTVRIATQTLQGTTPTTQKVQVQNGVATIQGATTTNNPAVIQGQANSANGTTANQSNVYASQSMQPKTNGTSTQQYQQTTTTQPNTVRIATQTVQGTTPTSQQIQVQNGIATTQGSTTTAIARQGQATTVNGTTTQTYQQTTIKDENHNPLTIETNAGTAARLSNKDNYSQNQTKITQISEPNRKLDVYFRVQISAGHRLVNTKFYFAKLNIRDNIIVEQVEGWFKYTINKFDTYVNARNQRNNLWNESPIKDAFVVAYNGRNRITVQEALMITNQKWVQ